MSKNTVKIQGRQERKVGPPGKASGASLPDLAVGKSVVSKASGKRFTPGAGKQDRRQDRRQPGKLAPTAKPVAPKGGWKAWEDESAARVGSVDVGRGQDGLEPVVPVSPEVLAQLRQESQQSLVQSVVVQWSVSVIVALIALVIGGKAAGLSGLLGAACVALPNSLLAFKLLMNFLRPDGGSGTTVLVGEFVKIGAVVLLLVLVVKLGGALIVWPALLAGLIAALKSYWVMLALASIQRKGP